MGHVPRRSEKGQTLEKLGHREFGRDSTHSSREALLFDVAAIGYKAGPVLIPILIFVIHDGAEILCAHGEESGLPGATIEVV